MKKYLLLAAIAASMCSCKTPALPAPYVTSSIIDYSSITSEGYFITEANSVSFEYDAIGSIQIEAHRGWKKKNKKASEFMNYEYDDYYYNAGKANKQYYVRPDVDSAIEAVKEIIKKEGADGIINVKMTYVVKPGLKANHMPLDEYIQVTGMLIKRK